MTGSIEGPERIGRDLAKHTRLFFISVDSKEFSEPVSFLLATLTGNSISVDSSRLRSANGQKCSWSWGKRRIEIGRVAPCFCKIVTGKELTGGGCTKV